MKRVISIFVLILFFGCALQSEPVPQVNRAAVDSLNEQIEQFNAMHQSDWGVSPIDQRVSRVELDASLGQVVTFDRKGKRFLVLKRQPDGRYKAVLEQPYHQLVGSGPDGDHSWGHILVEFFLEKGLF